MQRSSFCVATAQASGTAPVAPCALYTTKRERAGKFGGFKMVRAPRTQPTYKICAVMLRVVLVRGSVVFLSVSLVLFCMTFIRENTHASALAE